MKKYFTLFCMLILADFSNYAFSQAIDFSFKSGLAATDIVYSIVIQDDGKFIVGGTINNSNPDASKPRNIARLNPDGSVDNIFDVGTGFNGLVRKITLQDDGKVLVGGNFSEFNGIAVNKLVRLNQDGTLDQTFEIIHSFINNDWSEVSEIKVAKEGQIYIGGTGRTQWQNISTMIKRLSPEGVLDEEFSVIGDYYANIFAIEIQENEKLLVAGRVSTYQNYLQQLGPIRLNEDGSIDTTFKISNTDNKVTSIAIQDDEKVLVGGHFLKFDNKNYSNLVRLDGTGIVDESLNIGVGFFTRSGTGFIGGPLGGVNHILTLEDGEILVSGSFERYQGVPVYGLAKVNSTGSLEQTLNSCGLYRENGPQINQSVILLDGSVVSAGKIGVYDGIPNQNNVIKVLSEPTPYGIVEADFDVILVGRKASFVNNSKNATTFEWDLGDGSKSTFSNPTKVYNSPGNYAVSLTTKGFCGESITSTKNISVFGVSNVHPKKGGNQGYVTLSLTGLGFTDQTKVNLTKGGENIEGTTSFVSSSGDEIQVYFDLTEKSLGEWEVDVKNGNLKLDAKETFEIENVIAPEIHAEFVGRNQIRAGREERLTVRYSNTGNVDALMVPLTLQFPSNVSLELYDSTLLVNDFAEKLGFENYVEDTSSFIINFGSLSFFPIIIPLIPANSSGQIDFLISSLESSEFDISIISNESLLKLSNEDLIGGRILENQDCSLAYLGAGTALAGASLAGLGIGAVGLGASIPVGVGSACAVGILDAIDDLAVAYHNWNRSSGLETSSGYLSGVRFANALTGLQLASCNALVNSVGLSVKLISSGVFLTKLGVGMVGAGTIIAGLGVIKNPSCFGELKRLFNQSIDVIAAYDPNEKAGPTNITEDNYTQGIAPFTYTVFFENLDSATAAAQEVIILDTLDNQVLDLSTFMLTGYGYGNERYSIPTGLSAYSNSNPLQRNIGDAMNVRFDGFLNPENGVVKWRFLSVDPGTGELIDDPIDGFLPPNKTPGEGEGYVTFSIMPKQDLPTGTRIENKALIYFDFNEPIVTNTFVNTIDKEKPKSKVIALPAVSADTLFTVSWSGEDTNSGIRSYDVLVSVNDGPYGLWQYDVTTTSAEFKGHADSLYRFFSIAKDYAGNIESEKTQFEAETTVLLRYFTIEGISTTDPSCEGIDNGSITVNTSNSNVILEYSLDNNIFQDENTFEGLAPGDYILYIRDKVDTEIKDETQFTIGQPLNESPPIPTISIQGSDAISQEVTLVSSSVTGNQWYRDGTAIPNANGQNLKITESGAYHVVVTGTGGCSSMSEIVALTSTPEIKSFNIKLYPNPADRITKIDFGRESSIDRFIIYSSNGIILREVTGVLNVSEINIDLEGLPSGNYIIQVERSGTIEKLRLIKK